MRNHAVPTIFIVSGFLIVFPQPSHARAFRDSNRPPAETEPMSPHPDATILPSWSDAVSTGSTKAFRRLVSYQAVRGPGAVPPGEAARDARTAPVQDDRPGAAQASADLVQPQVTRTTSSPPPAVAPLFEQPGVLTPRGKFVFEPILQFSNSSSNRISVMGYTIIPTLFPGRLDVREVRRNSTTATLTVRGGITDRLELELRVPYVYRSDDFVTRELSSSNPVDRVFQGSGKSLGDVELATRYQFNEGGNAKPYFVGSLRFKSRTGRDPFEVVTDCIARCVGPNAGGTGLQMSLPTGSGFYALEPGLIWVMPSDPAILFGTFSYMHNFKRSNISRTVLDGIHEPLGEIAPGDSFQANVGLGFALNDRASVSLGYDHNTIGRARQNKQPVPGAVRTQLGTIMVGFSYRIDNKRTINVSIGGGLTRDTPDVSMMVRMPLTL